MLRLVGGRVPKYFRGNLKTSGTETQETPVVYTIQGNDEELHCNTDLLEEAPEQASVELCSVKVNFLNSVILKFIIHIFKLEI